MRGAVAAGIEDLRRERRADPARNLVPRLRGEAARLTRAQAAALRRMLAV